MGRIQNAAEVSWLRSSGVTFESCLQSPVSVYHAPWWFLHHFQLHSLCSNSTHSDLSLRSKYVYLRLSIVVLSAPPPTGPRHLPYSFGNPCFIANIDIRHICVWFLSSVSVSPSLTLSSFISHSCLWHPCFDASGASWCVFSTFSLLNVCFFFVPLPFHSQILFCLVC